MPKRKPVLAVVALLVVVVSTLATPADSFLFWSFKVTVRNQLGPGSWMHIRCTKSDYVNARKREPVEIPVREKLIKYKEEVVIGHMPWYQYNRYQFQCRYSTNTNKKFCLFTLYKYDTANPVLLGTDRVWEVRSSGIYEKDPTEFYGYALRYPHCEVYNPRTLMMAD